MDSSDSGALRRPVVVGVGPRHRSWLALTWALEEATRRRRPLHVIHAQGSRTHSSTPGPHGRDEPFPPVVAAAVSRAHELAPDLEVTAEVCEGTPERALTEASAHASCIVVGGHSGSALPAQLLGSTADEVAVHAACPVVAVRRSGELRQARSSVVVGVDGSELSASAVGYAFARAAEHALPLTVVHACPSRGGKDYVPPWRCADPAAGVEAERAATAQELAGWSGEYPDVRVNAHVLRADPVAALVDHSRAAALLVVGSRGFGGWSGRLVGSVSQAVMGRAHCPVAVVRSDTPS